MINAACRHYILTAIALFSGGEKYGLHVLCAEATQVAAKIAVLVADIGCKLKSFVEKHPDHELHADVEFALNVLHGCVQDGSVLVW